MSIEKSVAESSEEKSHNNGSGPPSAIGGWRIKQRKEPGEKSLQKTPISSLINQQVAPQAGRVDKSKRRPSSEQRRSSSSRFKWVGVVALRRKPLAILSSIAVIVIAFTVFWNIDLNSSSPGKSTQVAQADASNEGAHSQTETKTSDRQIRAIALPALEDEGFLPIYFRLTEPVDRPVDITYETIAHTASAETDFAAKNGTVTIRPGDVSAEITIPLVDDDDIESIEMFRVRLSTDTSSVHLTDEELMATVLDDDRAAASTQAN